MNFGEFCSRFATDEACIEHLILVRWKGVPKCNHCESTKVWKMTTRPRYWACGDCGKHFSITEGTPLDRTHLPLPIWFQAIFLMATSSKGVSAMVLSRQLNIGYKTAWFLAHRVRQMLEDTAQLEGIVEVDETYLGGKKRKEPNKRDDEDDQPKGRGGSRRLMAITAVERGGKAKAQKGKTHSGKTIAQAVYSMVSPNSILSTDELPAYKYIGRRFRAHIRVNHSKGEWVRRDPLAITCAHTNTVESFNATIKRAIMGVWHWFSIGHADRYLAELAHRWNMRGMNNLQRFDCVLSGIFHKPLPWNSLVLA